MKLIDYLKGYWLLMIAMLIYSFTAITNKMASQYRFLSIEWIMYYGAGILFLCLYALTWQQVLNNLELSRAYAGRALGTVLEFLWGFIVFKERITPRMLIGGGIVMIGVLIVTMEKGQKTDA